MGGGGDGVGPLTAINIYQNWGGGGGGGGQSAYGYIPKLGGKGRGVQLES